MSNFSSLKEGQKKAWLVTGCAGFIGSNLLEALLKNDQVVIGLDNFSTGKKNNIEDILAFLTEEQIKNFTFVEGDIRDNKLCHEVTKNVDYVLHQAALGSVPRSLKDPITTNEVNVSGFLNVLSASQENKVSRFVYASSSAVYGDSRALPKSENKIGKPLSPYAVSKRTNELYGEVFSRCYSMPTFGLRYFNVFGPRQDPESVYAAVIPLWIMALLRDQPCYINGDGSHSRDFCYVNNVVEANIKAALTQNPQTYGQVFNIAFGKQTTLQELYSLTKEHIGPVKELQPIYREERPGDVKHSLANIDQAKTLLGYDPKYSFEEGLRLTVEWFKEKNKA
ncbi:MAG: hypothetical protein ACD_16C00038G0006 [uncultured bacterium]|nr:MAG: hypothetical protein ACD_16C00038G0006 [uncultured bacterium]OFW69125.1 MAG: Vi polysaccharide biosynthesis protein VipB/TviC [Alphaproteobacteria bacterium GWC2_42_16]OFW73977.1 MAG: Vi polysaccharide biosynthesis protein VipB/TviC [Alphaproteobacteria bacterium GWA2_41_27]OFW82543.1 MAG: Vi polysaccharide biosynthesis protein VipB/TviC [Alphaproteobacteria bacterium RIFCSPHIGHO2_12_FULL_42_100]OFW85823.1 MAG: Vi polysaccharide biosynthesis protein VipB/TviC [Alphaproteobacteria bacter